MCPLGLELQRYHACRNDCMIYRGKDANLKNCPVCKKSRYKRGREPIEDSGEKVKGGTPTKVVWYLPLIPRMRRLFANKKKAELMRWHATWNKVDSDVLRHPADGMQWQSIDVEYQDFGDDPRNI